MPDGYMGYLHCGPQLSFTAFSEWVAMFLDLSQHAPPLNLLIESFMPSSVASLPGCCVHHIVIAHLVVAGFYQCLVVYEQHINYKCLV